MAKKKEDIAGLNEEQLIQEIGETEDRLKRMKFSHAITPIENPMDIRFARKKIARLKTELRKRQLS